MTTSEKISNLITKHPLVIDGAMGTQIQAQADNINEHAWEGNEGCNELLNVTAPDVIRTIHKSYLGAGADLIKTNTFGAIPWVLDDYNIGDRTYELARAGAEIVKELCMEFSTEDKPRFVLGALGPGTKLPSLGHIDYDTMYKGYKEAAHGLIDGGANIFLLETAQDPLQIKIAIHACEDICKSIGIEIPIMVSATVELSGTMLIGTDASTLATILEPFNILSLGFNCGTGPQQVENHVKILSEDWNRPISVHSNAGLPQNRGGYTFYPMGPKEFTEHQEKFLEIDGVSFLGGCCGTTPQHILELSKKIENIKPKKATGSHKASLASLFQSTSLVQNPAPFLIGERSNATGSKAFRELLLNEDYEGTLSVAQQQVRASAHGLDVSVGFAGRDEQKDMNEVIRRYAQNIALPLMPDSTQILALETALKLIGGKAIINSVNLEDGIEKFDAICKLARRYGTALVCLAIDEKGMAKTAQEKIDIAERMYKLATENHGLRSDNLVFDLLTFTVGSGDAQYHTAAIETINAIAQFHEMHPEVGLVLGLSNISFGLAKHAREYLNAVFLHHCVEAGLSMAIINAKNIIPLHKIADDDLKACEDLLFNKREDGDPLFAFIDHFSEVKSIDNSVDDATFNALSNEEKIAKLLMDGNKEKMLIVVEEARKEIKPEVIVNEILIDAMKVVGELFGSGQMQLPFVLQSAETMKSAVDALNPYLPKIEKTSETVLILGTVRGDVHDVGKNLVDIILTNNGFKVINLGIKVGIDAYIEAYEKYGGSAIGMSGLLVKSTLEMKQNLQALKSKGIDVPILLGGAALTRSFVDDFCRTEYDGLIFYCRDAFDGITSMGRIEKGDSNTNLGSDGMQEEIIKKEEMAIEINEDDVILPSYDYPVPTPPTWGKQELKSFDKRLTFEWINESALFKQRWGYKRKKMDVDKYEKLINDEVRPMYSRLKNKFLDDNLFEPTVIYGYWPCRADGDTLLIFGINEGWQKDIDASKEPLEDVRGRAIASFKFPRQGKSPHRALSDYFHSDRHDVIALTLVSAGSKISEYEQELFKENLYTEYHAAHGLGVELAESLAEIVHKHIRMELGILQKEKASLYDVKMKQYQGARYSFGYAACPDLELNRVLFDLLEPEKYGIELSETFQIHPEQSTSALVVYNPEAMYYNI